MCRTKVRNAAFLTNVYPVLSQSSPLECRGLSRKMRTKESVFCGDVVFGGPAASTVHGGGYDDGRYLFHLIAAMRKQM